MKSVRWYLSFGVLMAGLSLLVGCPKKTEVGSVPEAQPQKVVGAPAAGAETSAEAAAAAARAAEEARAKEAAGRNATGLRPIYFDFDKSNIRDDARAVMKENAAYLKAHSSVKVLIEGNGDERGTIEYNQALGQRRAASAKKYFADLGISGKRVQLISYGKEKPVCTQSTEECWQKNRRDDLVVASH